MHTFATFKTFLSTARCDSSVMSSSPRFPRSRLFSWRRIWKAFARQHFWGSRGSITVGGSTLFSCGISRNAAEVAHTTTVASANKRSWSIRVLGCLVRISKTKCIAERSEDVEIAIYEAEITWAIGLAIDQIGVNWLVSWLIFLITSR